MSKKHSPYEVARNADLEASGLEDPKLIKKLGLTNVLGSVETSELTGWDDKRYPAMSYEIPYHALDGSRTDYSRYKLIGLGDDPLPMKYYQEDKTIPRIYLPPLVHWQKIADDVRERIIITEGEKKAACACLHGLPTIGLGGVWNWKSKKWSYATIPDVDLIKWDGRDAEICFDADMSTNENVRKALDALCAELKRRGARVFVRRMPNTEGIAALDDFLVKHGKKHGVERYQALECVEWGATLVDSPDNPVPNVRRILNTEFYHPDHALLVHQGDTFHRWNGTCWPTLEDGDLRARLYAWAEPKTYSREGKAGGLAPFAPNSAKISNLVDAMCGVTRLATEFPVPTWLDNRTAPPPNEVISCSNGLLHWPTRKLYPHTPLFYTRYSVPYAFDPKASPPKRWKKFLAELWPKDAESVRALQEIVGYMISGDTLQQKMFLLVGPKRGGKGTIGRVVGKLLGPHNVAGPTLASLGGDFGLQPLIDKPVAIISDARLGGRTDGSVVTERLLSISGEDTLTVSRKHLTSWSGKLPTRVLMLSNELPRFTDASGAIASRFVILVLTESFYDRENINLTEELCEELPGIFNWALDGLKSLRARGKFVQPRQSLDAVREMEDLGSPVKSFVRECCELGPTQSVLPDELFQRWRTWCLRSNHQAGAKETFGKHLRAAVPAMRRKQRGSGKNKKWVHEGIGLKPEPKRERS